MNIAVDLGGTNVRVGLVEGNRIVRLLSQPCHAKGPEEEVTGQIFSMIEELLPGSPVKGIGVGVPSVVDMDKGIVYDVIGIPSWKEVHLKELLEARFSLPAYINNDCNCFALGVSRFGEAKGYREAVCVTLGTGVGSSLGIQLSVANLLNSTVQQIVYFVGSIGLRRIDGRAVGSYNFVDEAGNFLILFAQLRSDLFGDNRVGRHASLTQQDVVGVRGVGQEIQNLNSLFRISGSRAYREELAGL